MLGCRRIARKISSEFSYLQTGMAERQGFEPWGRLRAQRFSRPPRSTAPAPLRERVHGPPRSSAGRRSTSGADHTQARRGRQAVRAGAVSQTVEVPSGRPVRSPIGVSQPVEVRSGRRSQCGVRSRYRPVRSAGVDRDAMAIAGLVTWSGRRRVTGCRACRSSR
jgi:hypothetical protein